MASASAIKDDADWLRLEEEDRFHEGMKNTNLAETGPSIRTRSEFEKLKKIKSEKRELTKAPGSEARNLGSWLSKFGEIIIWGLKRWVGKGVS